MKTSDYIVSFFESKGINTIFGYIGGMITHLVDSIDKNPNVTFIQTYHEQTAAIAAEGYAIESGKFGVSISTSGPGATNMMTGIADAYFDSIPVVYITGQVNSYEYKYNKPIRQQGFQETDVVSLVKPITKYAVLIDKAENIRYELEKAVNIATTGRKGPVLLDICMDVQRTDICPQELKSYTINPDETIKFAIQTDEIIKLIEQSKSPMILVGGGCLNKEVEDEINKFVSKTNIPIVTSLKGRGCVDETYDNYMGMIGSYGNRCANMSMKDVDLLIALGTRIDTRQSGAKIEHFISDGKIIHVDIDNSELHYNRLKNRITIKSDVLCFMKKLNEKLIKTDLSDWNSYLLELKHDYNQDQEINRFVQNKSPYKLMQKLNDYSDDVDVITVDIGQNQMWAAQTLRLKTGQKFITSGGLAPMGFSLPAAIGVSFANPSKHILAICGDGGFHMSIQSLMLISQYNLPIKVVVMNNKALGMITQFQHLYFSDRMAGTTQQGGYHMPNMELMAKCYNLRYLKLSEELLGDDNYIDEVFSNSNCIIDYQINGLTTVSPKLEYNQPIWNMTPYLSEEKLKKSFLYKNGIKVNKETPRN